jgi:hypothetical protein
MQMTEGRGVYGATDAVGGDTLTQVITSLRKGGTGDRNAQAGCRGSVSAGESMRWCTLTRPCAAHPLTQQEAQHPQILDHL